MKDDSLYATEHDARQAFNPIARDEIVCPYGRPGDHLWVREMFCADDGHYSGPVGYLYRADFEKDLDVKIWTPSIHMPRAASRITLEVTGIRVERLQNISREDAIAEGATSRPNCAGYSGTRDGWCMDWSPVGRDAAHGTDRKLTESDICHSTPQSAFGNLINTLHGGKNWNLKPTNLWDQNPFVWVVEFRRIKP